MTTRGTLISLASSLVFGVIFFIAPQLGALHPSQLLAWRLLVAVPVIAIAVRLLGRWDEITKIARRIRSAPLLLLVVIADSALLGGQLWLFGWAPQTGHGLELALGFLLLPLVMALAGVVFRGERLIPASLAACAFALIGVLAAVAGAGGISATTLLVALGYPCYFILRGHFALNTLGATVLEFTALLPFACVFGPSAWPLIAADPQVAGLVLALGGLSAIGFLAYLQASTMLPLSLFGFLGYVEPLLLIAIAIVFLGEPVTTSNLFVYAPILMAMVVLMSASIRNALRGRNAQ